MKFLHITLFTLFLISGTASLADFDAKKIIAIHDACRKSNAKQLSEILNENIIPERWQKVTKDASYEALCACFGVKDSVDLIYQSPLLAAASNGSISCVKLLLTLKDEEISRCICWTLSGSNRAQSDRIFTVERLEFLLSIGLEVENEGEDINKETISACVKLIKERIEQKS